MAYDVADTIVAVASPPGGAERGIVRVGGPGAVAVVEQLFAALDGRPLAEQHAACVVGGSVNVAGFDRELSIPCDLFLWPGERSYTRQPVAELHTVGSPPLLEALVALVIECGARAAEPGEFTLRAFLAGRIDLTQAEAVLGVIDAEDERQLATALEQLAGGLGSELEALRADIVGLLADLEAGLDFVDEDIEFVSREEVASRLRSAGEQIDHLQQRMKVRLTPGELPRVVLAGRPNAGKSSLFNALREQYGVENEQTSGAIVSDESGTTRDYITAAVSLAGERCLLVDTAGVDGVEPSKNPLEHKAQQAATAERGRAGVVLWCRPVGSDEAPPDGAVIAVATKLDLAGECVPEAAIACSAVTGAGVDRVAQAVADRLASASSGGCVASTATRAAESLAEAQAAIGRATGLVSSDGGDELIAAELRALLDAVGRLVGRLHPDEVLDQVFSRFCIGK